MSDRLAVLPQYLLPKQALTTLAGLVLYAADDPIDIRAIGPGYQKTMRYSGLGLVGRVLRAVKEYF